MTRWAILGLLAAGVLVTAVSGQQARRVNTTTTIPLTNTAANNGHQMFNSYCAPCHGRDGRGHGPAAAALRPGPADLTRLAAKSGGKYPDARVVATIEFGAGQHPRTVAHGSAQMPVWGPILGNMNHSHPELKQLRVYNLSRYIETLQVP